MPSLTTASKQNEEASLPSAQSAQAKSPFPSIQPARTTPEPGPKHSLSLSPDHQTRKRSNSILQHLRRESITDENDQVSATNLNADWVHHKGAWLIHIVIILALLLLYDGMPWVSTELSWTLTNVTYVIGSYIMFHYVTGVPFDFNSGAYDTLTMWEQIDDGDQYTPSKKFLLGVPITLFLVSTHFTHYALSMFLVNFFFCLLAVIPKLPGAHRLRLVVDDELPSPTIGPSHLGHNRIPSKELKN